MAPPIDLTNPIVLQTGPGTSVIVYLQPDDRYLTAAGETVSPEVVDTLRTKASANQQLDPSDPYGTQWTGEARVAALKAAGYSWSPQNQPGAQGPSALWVSPEGNTVTEVSALARVLEEGAESPAAASFSGSGLPAGYVQGSDGLTYRQVPGGLVEASQAELDAINAPKPSTAATPRFGFQQIGGKVYKTNDLTGVLEDTGVSAPGFSNFEVNPKTGDLEGQDANGNWTVIKAGFGFASVDPALNLPTPDFRRDAQGKAYEWTGAKWEPAPQFDDPTKASGFVAPRAPQARATGTLPNGAPYVFDPEQPAGKQFTGLNGAPLSPVDFAAIPQTIQANDGRLYFVDPQTKAVTQGPLVGFAGVDPARGAALDEAAVTGFYNGRPTYARETSARQFGFDQAGAAEAAGIDRARLAEDARRANLQSATSAFGDVTRVARLLPAGPDLSASSSVAGRPDQPVAV